MFLKIPRLYDSHTHFLATGELASGLNLQSLQSAAEIAQWDLSKKSFYRGDWLVGFGWQDAKWPSPPRKEILDQLFPNRPVYLAKGDGHTSWVNSAALRELSLNSETGLLTEADHLRSWDLLPTFTEEQQRNNILAACRVYNSAGFTHVRDMTGNESLWNSLTALENENLLTVAFEENFTCYDLAGFEKSLHSALYAKKNETALLRSKGIKFFYDGSLGSETAYLSKPYFGLKDGNRGRVLWNLNDVEIMIKRTWQAGLDISVHTIGDEAAHDIVSLARKISAQGFVGRLNLEHVQVLRPETIQMMKSLHVRCHMQPCHWLSDRVWLKEKLADLYRYAFPWEALRAAQIPLSFGCDSPVEKPSFIANQRALQESPEENIRRFTGSLEETHAHPDNTFAANSYTVFENEQVKEVVFQGRSLL
ncbi:MAG TPA: amidohydrolase family protein [Bdellovibrio sp.]|nr:amidohydrolase family protein [Bdellovibrio sp.]